MAMTSEDVVGWELKTGMRGYAVPQVDELLDEVADELDRLHARIAELESERDAVRNSIDEQLEVEDTLKRTLYQAQKAADQTIVDAREEADRIREEATAASNALLESARTSSQESLDAAQVEAERERSAVRARLEVEETRMRATGSELRRNLVSLHAIEQETRLLLRGLHEDRLRLLERPEVPLPDFDDDHYASQGFVEEATVESSVDEADVRDEATMSVEVAGAVDVAHGSSDQSVGLHGDEGDVDTDLLEALEHSALESSSDGNSDDSDDDDDAILGDDPAVEVPTAVRGKTGTPELFGDAPPRRRRRTS